jgi:hypothetical protein
MLHVHHHTSASTAAPLTFLQVHHSPHSAHHATSVHCDSRASASHVTLLSIQHLLPVGAAVHDSGRRAQQSGACIAGSSNPLAWQKCLASACCRVKHYHRQQLE